jgi:hypothetical protein
VIASGRLRNRRELLFLLVPPLIYLAASMKSGMNIGICHILPVYIFLAIVVIPHQNQVFRIAERQRRRRMPSTSENIALIAPMPRVSMRMTVKLAPGAFNSWRNAIGVRVPVRTCVLP